MNTIGEINFKKILRISPSQFTAMKNCPYKSLLAEALDRKPLLPFSANAYYGTVLHKMIELIAKGVVKTEDEFNQSFQEQIGIMENELISEGHRHLVPLQKSVRNFTEKLILLKEHLPSSTSNQKRNDKRYSSERWFESSDTLVGGKIDLLIESEDTIEILDFKTGAITEDSYDDAGELSQNIKLEYREQLKLYAYLYFDKYGNFPNKLSLISLGKQKFNVEFSEGECRQLFDEATRLLQETNESVDSKVFRANPNESNCKFCLYRPSCKFYLEHLRTNMAFNDVCGLLTNVVQYQNGNVTAFLIVGDETVSITGFKADRFDSFNLTRNKQIGCFNLKREATGNLYSATKTTTIYEQGSTI